MKSEIYLDVKLEKFIYYLKILTKRESCIYGFNNILCDM